MTLYVGKNQIGINPPGTTVWTEVSGMEFAIIVYGSQFDPKKYPNRGNKGGWTPGAKLLIHLTSSSDLSKILDRIDELLKEDIENFKRAKLKVVAPSAETMPFANDEEREQAKTTISNYANAIQKYFFDKGRFPIRDKDIHYRPVDPNKKFNGEVVVDWVNRISIDGDTNICYV